LSDLALGDLAAAAVRTGRQDQALELLNHAEARNAGGSLRRTLTMHRARALLGPADDAEHHFRLSLINPGGEQWPFERAMTRLNYAEWLRRRQRPTDARPQLIAARETFRALGTPTWSARADAELAATGAARSARQATGLQSLTAQQRAIADLAAGGLSNRQIAEQMMLSVRTVTTHLSHVFTQLDIARRTQLTEALRAGDADGPQE
jgi:DNA-binding CsgD family transcriptional regulator